MPGRSPRLADATRRLDPRMPENNDRKHDEKQQRDDSRQDQRPSRDDRRKRDEKQRRGDELQRRLAVPQRPGRSPFTAWIIFIFIAVMALMLWTQNRPQDIEISYDELMEQVRGGNIGAVTVEGRYVQGRLLEPSATTLDSGEVTQYTEFISWLLVEDPDFVSTLEELNPDAELRGQPPATNWGGILFSVLPLAVIVIFWIFIMRSMRGGGGAGRAFSFGKSNARLLTEDRPKVTFEDVAGLPEAKLELREIVEFLKAPKKFTRLGGKIPKGALLIGPPGTGKTLLARAVAGEAEVPFLSISGSDFVEMFVGVGASRVRDLFEQGKTNAPCIIFIDELDAVGRMRGAGLGGGHDEREQTLNQLLVEMDGFESNEGVILVAATNRPDVLDTALLRPGRFDRQIVVDLPDLKGREGILKVSAKKVIIDEAVDFETLARGTPGLSGADLANLVNEAALHAARANRDSVMMVDFEEAKDKIMLGIERKSKVFSEKELKVTAYHEAGHTLVGWFTPGTSYLHKVTIVPRGRALGVTHFLNKDESEVLPKQHWLDELAVLLGGRAAEEVAFNEITTGAAGDIRYATEISRSMVCNWGMSDKLGPVSFGHAKRQVFLGREMAYPDEISERTAELIDSEIRRFVDESLDRARTLVRENKEKLHDLAKALLDRETLTSEDVEAILGARPKSADESSVTHVRAPHPADHVDPKTSAGQGVEGSVSRAGAGTAAPSGTPSDEGPPPDAETDVDTEG